MAKRMRRSGVFAVGQERERGEKPKRTRSRGRVREVSSPAMSHVSIPGSSSAFFLIQAPARKVRRASGLRPLAAADRRSRRRWSLISLARSCSTSLSRACLVAVSSLMLARRASRAATVSSGVMARFT